MMNMKGRVEVQGRERKQSERETLQVLADLQRKQELIVFLKNLTDLGNLTTDILREAAELGITPLDLE